MVTPPNLGKGRVLVLNNEVSTGGVERMAEGDAIMITGDDEASWSFGDRCAG